MGIIIQKFGGSSLSTPELRGRLVERVREAIDRGDFPVIVVSAMGRHGDPYATDSILELIRQVNPESAPRNLDLALSCGENLSAVVVAETLNFAGIRAVAMTGWQCRIKTDDNFGNARILSVDSGPILELRQNNLIPVVAGFQGITSHGDVTTLGRGGSDTTAVALGVALKADFVEIFTDVEGVKTADPRLVPEAATLTAVTYRELAELAHLGAKVIHPRAVEIAMEEGVTLKIKSSFQLGEGTLVSNAPRGRDVRERGVGDRVVTGIAHIAQRAQVRITGSENFNRSRQALEIFDALAAHSISVDLIYLSPDLVAFIIDVAQVELAKKVLAGFELNTKVEKGFAKVSVVGAGMHGVPGVMARIVGCLEEAGVDIFQTTDSHANISCLVRECDLRTAVRALHREFQLSEKEV